MSTLAPLCCGPRDLPDPAPKTENTTCCQKPPADASTACCESEAQEEACCAPDPAETAGCCATSEPAVITTGLARLEDAAAAASAGREGTWPYLHPAWLQATTTALPEARPWHAVAHRGQDTVLLPGFVFDAPSLVDVDPRTYLGWQPASGQSACCSVSSCCNATTDVEALGEDPFFPCLVLGSPVGYRSEAVATTDDPLLIADLLDEAIPAARRAGFRSILAPWIADLPANEPLLLALNAHGATLTFWGEENVLTLDRGSYDDHMNALTSRKRRRLKGDHARALASGVEVVRKDGTDLLPVAGRIAELTAINRTKYDGSEGPEEIHALLTGMIHGGADVRAYLGYKDGHIVASTVAFRQGERLFLKWAGFDYDAVGERSGLYFELTFDRPLRDAYAEGLAAMESGPGADQAKRLRGCRPRAVHTALLMTQEKVARKTAELQETFGQARRDALNAATADGPAGRLLAKFRGSPKLEPITPIQPAGGCCG